jgi:hypothetical protein
MCLVWTQVTVTLYNDLALSKKQNHRTSKHFTRQNLSFSRLLVIPFNSLQSLGQILKKAETKQLKNWGEVTKVTIQG